MRWLFSSVVALAAVTAVVSAQQAEQFARLRSELAKAVEAKTVPGAIVVLRHNGKVVFQDAQGVADGQALKTDTVF